MLKLFCVYFTIVLRSNYIDVIEKGRNNCGIVEGKEEVCGVGFIRESLVWIRDFKMCVCVFIYMGVLVLFIERV